MITYKCGCINIRYINTFWYIDIIFTRCDLKCWYKTILNVELRQTPELLPSVTNGHHCRLYCILIDNQPLNQTFYCYVQEEIIYYTFYNNSLLLWSYILIVIFLTYIRRIFVFITTGRYNFIDFHTMDSTYTRTANLYQSEWGQGHKKKKKK